MKITRQDKEEVIGPRVKYVAHGKPVQFTRSFNSNYPPTELFLVLDTPTCYVNDKDRNKTQVACIATGKVSHVDGNRTVVVMNAEVKVDGPAT